MLLLLLLLSLLRRMELLHVLAKLFPLLSLCLSLRLAQLALFAVRVRENVHNSAIWEPRRHCHNLPIRRCIATHESRMQIRRANVAAHGQPNGRHVVSHRSAPQKAADRPRRRGARGERR